MLIIELLILLFAHLWPGIVSLLFIVKDIRLIEDKYWRAAGYQLDKLKKILVVLSLLVIPVILTVGSTIYVWTDILTDPDVLTNPDVLLWILSVPLCIISCAVAEAILLNRGEEKHRALPWGLAAVNAVSALLLAALLAALDIRLLLYASVRPLEDDRSCTGYRHGDRDIGSRAAGEAAVFRTALPDRG